MPIDAELVVSERPSLSVAEQDEAQEEVGRIVPAQPLHEGTRARRDAIPGLLGIQQQGTPREVSVPGGSGTQYERVQNPTTDPAHLCLLQLPTVLADEETAQALSPLPVSVASGEPPEAGIRPGPRGRVSEVFKREKKEVVVR